MHGPDTSCVCCQQGGPAQMFHSCTAALTACSQGRAELSEPQCETNGQAAKVGQPRGGGSAWPPPQGAAGCSFPVLMGGGSWADPVLAAAAKNQHPCWDALGMLTKK